jgi:hypothetical protein
VENPEEMSDGGLPYAYQEVVEEIHRKHLVEIKPRAGQLGEGILLRYISLGCSK